MTSICPGCGERFLTVKRAITRYGEVEGMTTVEEVATAYQPCGCHWLYETGDVEGRP